MWGGQILERRQRWRRFCLFVFWLFIYVLLLWKDLRELVELLPAGQWEPVLSCSGSAGSAGRRWDLFQLDVRLTFYIFLYSVSTRLIISSKLFSAVDAKSQWQINHFSSVTEVERWIDALRKSDRSSDVALSVYVVVNVVSGDGGVEAHWGF